MSINGTVNKTGLLLVLLVASAAFTWDMRIATSALSPATSMAWP